MSIPTVNVLVTVHEQDGSPAVGAQVIAKLMTTERYNGFVVPDEYSGVTNDDGNCTISLFPNELGTEGSEYKFKIIHRNGKTVNVFASIPNYDCSLHQISELDRYELRGAGQILTLEVAGYANDAIMARDNARAAELSTVNYSLEAQGYKNDAEIAANTATTKAAEIVASATIASTKATEASTSASNAATSATAANTAKVAAEGARDLVNSYKVDAQAARDKAQLWAEQTTDVIVETGKYSAKHHAAKAAASATAASTSKDTATTKASEAATSAANAATSASNAAASATAAANSATAANTSASNAAASAGNASTSAATANTKATEAGISATNAANSASAAATSKAGAEAAKDSAVTYSTEAQTASNKAKAWADNNENVYVEGSSYSAKHHAIKAAASATLAATHKTAAADSATSASNSATNAANSATLATTKANAAAVSADTAATHATNAELAAASIGVMSSQGVLLTGQDTIVLDWAYDPILGNVAVYLSGVKQEKASLTFVDQYTIKVGEAVSELTVWEVVSVTMAGESVLTTLRDQAVAARQSAEMYKLPIGSIVIATGTTAPAGCIVGDGTLKSRAAFPDLWAYAQASGNISVDDASWTKGQYSPGDGSTTFRVPNLQDQFIRGASDKRAVGNGEEDAFQGHFHRQRTKANTASGTNIYNGASDGSSFSATVEDVVSDGINGTPRTANETRPKNVAYLMCIKAYDTISDVNVLNAVGIVNDINRLESEKLRKDENINLGVSVAASGTAVDFVGIPEGVKRITVMFDGVRLNGSYDLLVQIGIDGAFETTGYISIAHSYNSTPAVVPNNATSAFVIKSGNTDNAIGGALVLQMSSGSCIATGTFLKADTAGSTNVLCLSAGIKTTDRINCVRIKGVSNSTLIAGTINISWEF